LKRPAISRTFGDDIVHDLMVEPEASGQGQDLGDGDHAHAGHHVIADLESLPGSGGADMIEIVAHGFEDRKALVVAAFGAANHED
jgi:hypothetical protein